MGITFKIVASERKLVDKIECDHCGKEIKKHSEGNWNPYGEPYSKFHKPLFDDYFLLQHSWGYSSRKDLETHEAVICEDCYDVIFKNVKIHIKHYA
jgi:hypothetical protein